MKILFTAYFTQFLASFRYAWKAIENGEKLRLKVHNMYILFLTYLIAGYNFENLQFKKVSPENKNKINEQHYKPINLSLDLKKRKLLIIYYLKSICFYIMVIGILYSIIYLF